MQCDFCSAPDPRFQYRTTSFGITTADDIFPDTPIHLHDDIPYVGTDDVHPLRGTGQMISPDWAACATCATFIDAKDHHGLTAYCIAAIPPQSLPPNTTPAELTDQYHLLFTVFFQNLRSARLPL
ncbi:MAG: hypothetical protein Q8S75_08180 [Nitrospirota bacterium]|nr:hypothetical protein [Nitrospirota bacterium]